MFVQGVKTSTARESLNDNNDNVIINNAMFEIMCIDNHTAS